MRYLLSFLLLLSPVLYSQSTGYNWSVFRGKSSLSGATDFELPEKPFLLWGASTNVRTKSSPVLNQDILYFGNDKGSVFAYDSRGELVWKYDTGSNTEAPPLVFGGTVFVGSADGYLRALDKNSGKLLYSYKTDNKISGSANYWEASSKSGIVFGSYDYFLHCIEPNSGKLLWKVETDNYINGTPAVFGDRVIFGGCDGILRVVDVLTGRETDTINIGVYIASSPAIYFGRAFLGDYDGELYCVDIRQRKIEWQVSATQNAGPIIAIPSAGGNYVAVGNDDKHMYCFNVNTGKQIWKFRTNGQITGSAVMTPSKVIFGSNDGNIYLLNLNDGKKLWSFNAGAPISSSPVVTRDRFYFLTEDGRLLAFGTKTK